MGCYKILPKSFPHPTSLYLTLSLSKAQAGDTKSRHILAWPNPRPPLSPSHSLSFPPSLPHPQWMSRFPLTPSRTPLAGGSPSTPPPSPIPSLSPPWSPTSAQDANEHVGSGVHASAPTCLSSPHWAAPRGR